MTIRALITFSIPVSAAVLLTACAVDVPVPDDPDARDWSPKIKAAYRNWQPPMKMPDGNPEYQAALIKKEAAKKRTASAIVSIEKGEKPETKAVVKEKKSAPAAEPVKTEVKAEAKAEPAPATEKKVDESVKVEVKAETKTESAKTETAKTEVKAEPVKTDAKTEVKTDVKTADAKAEVKTDVKAADAKTEPAAEQKIQKTAVKTKMVIDESATAAEYVVKEGESLSIIAKAQYKNGNLWYILLKANKDVVKDANKLKAGMKLSIPVLKSVPVGEK